MADVFRAQLDAAGSSAGYADGRLLLDAFHRAGTQYTIRKECATHLDAYASDKQNLRAIYEKTLGAKVVFTMEYDHDDIAKNHGNPEVVFIVFGDDIDGRDVEERHFGKDE